MTSGATSSKVLNDLRLLFQRFPQWKATVERKKHYLEVSMREEYLGAVWSDSGSLPYECLVLLEGLGWKANSGQIENGIYVTTLSIREDINI